MSYRLTEGNMKRNSKPYPSTKKPNIPPPAGDKPEDNTIRTTCMSLRRTCMHCKPADMPCQISKECKRERRERKVTDDKKHYDYANKVMEVVKESKDIPLSDINSGSMTAEDKDIFCAIMGQEFDLHDKPGTLAFAMYRLLAVFEIKRR